MKTQNEEYSRMNVIWMGRRKHSKGGGSRAEEDQSQQSVSENAKWNSLLCVTILKYIYNGIQLAVSWVIQPAPLKKQKEKKKYVRFLYVSLKLT